jgi:hypothetical protein
LGKPVHSIGHGTVTYAEPWGWGADKGVVIVRHVFPDGQTFLSFYGHLDPPSVVLKAGACVARGDVVGKIGKPRTSPHLHFEIRTHMPAEPGPGYWPVDPTKAGWKPPSLTIWQNRLSVSPGVQWMRAPGKHEFLPVGSLDEDTFVVVQNRELVGIDVRDGSERWRLGSSLSVHDAAIDPDEKTVYVTSLFGVVEALRPADDPPTSTWRIQLQDSAFPTLLPLGGGGVLAHTRDGLRAISAEGSLLWQIDAPLWVADWALAGDKLVLSTLGEGGSLWTVDQAGLAAWPTHTAGRLVVAGDRLLAYDSSGIHLLDPEQRTATPLYALPNGLLNRGDVVVLPGGDMVVVHQDRTRTSLLALTAAGEVRWRHSLTRIPGQKYLLALDGNAYLVAQNRTSSFSGVALYRIDLADGNLARVFDGGSRFTALTGTWVVAAGGEQVLVNLQGIGLVALDARLAGEAVAEASAQ